MLAGRVSRGHVLTRWRTTWGICVLVGCVLLSGVLSGWISRGLIHGLGVVLAGGFSRGLVLTRWRATWGLDVLSGWLARGLVLAGCVIRGLLGCVMIVLAGWVAIRGPVSGVSAESPRRESLSRRGHLRLV